MLSYLFSDKFFLTPLKLIHQVVLMEVFVQKNTHALTGEFLLTDPHIKISQAKRMQYSVNESYSASWDRRIFDFVDKKKRGDVPTPQR